MVEMSPDAVGARLATMSALSRAQPSPMVRGVDMAPAAIGARLRELSAVSALCWQLASARPAR